MTGGLGERDAPVAIQVERGQRAAAAAGQRIHRGSAGSRGRVSEGKARIFRTVHRDDADQGRGEENDQADEGTGNGSHGRVSRRMRACVATSGYTFGQTATGPLPTLTA